MQLAYDDPSAAYRLQDRVSSLHRIQLERIIERVLNEYAIPGKVIKINTLELDLGSIADADLEILLPVALERALRDELGQLMVRKDLDPMIEVETIPIAQNELEDWLFYLEQGTRKWTTGAGEFDLAKMLTELSRGDQKWLKERLMALIAKSNVVDRLLGDTSPEALPQLLALLAEGSVAETMSWIVQLQQQVVSHATEYGLNQRSKTVITHNLLKAWAQTGFTECTKERAKAITVQKVQAQLHVPLNAPLPEMAETKSGKPNSVNNSIEALKYLLFYGYWPAGHTAPSTEVGPMDLGSYLLQELANNRLEVQNVLHQLLAYPTVRKRLVHQLQREQLAQVMESVSPKMVQAIKVYDDWVATMPAAQRTILEASGLQRAIWLQMMEQEASAPSLAQTVQTYMAQLATALVTLLPQATIAALQQQAQSGTEEAQSSKAEQQTFTSMVLQRYHQERAKEHKDGTTLGQTEIEGKPEDETQYNDDIAPQRKPIVPKSLLLDADEYEEGEAPTENELKAIEAARAKLVSKEEDLSDEAPADGAPAESIEDEESEESFAPKNQLQAFLYFLRRGIWPEVQVANDSVGEIGADIIVPETVLIKLLRESPMTVLSEVFPLLVSARVRERLAYQLSHEAMQEVMVAFAKIHAPIKRQHEYYQQLLPLAVALPKAATSPALNGLPDAEVTLKTFMLWLLYEEPTIKSLEAYITHFLGYWQERGSLPLAQFGIAANAVLATETLPNAMASKVRQTLAAYITVNTPAPERDPQELEAEAREQMAAAMLLMDDYEAQPNEEDNDITIKNGYNEDEQVDKGLPESKAAQPIDRLVSEAEGGDEPTDMISEALKAAYRNAAARNTGTADKPTQKREVPDSDEGSSDIPLGDSESNDRLTKQPQAAGEEGTKPLGKRDGFDREGSEVEDSATADSKTNVNTKSKGIANLASDKKAADEGDGLTGTSSEGDLPSETRQSENQKANAANANLPSEERERQNSLPADTDGEAEDAKRLNPPKEEIEDTIGRLPDGDAEATIEYPLSPASSLPFVDSQLMMEEEETAEAETEIEHKTLKQKIEKINRKLIPERIKQAKVLRPQDPFAREVPQAPLEEPVFIENAGLVLLWPFIGRCFTMLGYTEKGLFKDMGMANRAVHLLQYMATAEEQVPEYLLVLNKLLCGIPVFEAVERDVVLTAQEKEEADALVRAVIGNWDKMNKLSVPAFRDSFLKRSGRLIENETSWTLRVDQISYDMLLDTLPWTIGMIKLRYMEKVLYVEWR